MKIKAKFFTPLVVFLLLGCAVNKTLTATGGSKSDGIVEMSYEYGGFESPKVDWAQGLSVATERCTSWGYQSAQAFGGTTKTCTSYNSYGCMQFFVTAKFQCTE